MVPSPRTPPAAVDRAGILELVRTGGAGVTTAEIAGRTGLRPSTVRDHLDALVECGLLVKARASGGLPYRPAWRYRAAAEDPPGSAYRLLLAPVLEYLAAAEPRREEADRVGRHWGRMFAAAHHGKGGATDTLLAVLRALGFSPRAVSPGACSEVRLLTCPYLTLVRQHPDEMCRLHAGIIRGALRESGAADDTAVLEPFGAPDGCVVRLGPPPAKGPA
jgi:predicted ArsR family transcriptional regulator